MTKLLSSVLLAGLAAGTAVAGPGGSKGVSHPTSGGISKPIGTHVSGPGRSVGSHPGSMSGSYHLTHGKSFSGGYFYPGRNHSHWSYSGYSQRYGCTCYWCPYTSCYYYWCPSATCYYPVSYFASAPVVPVAVATPAPVVAPPAVQVQVQTQTQTQTQTQAQQQGPPVGVPPLP